MSGQVYGAGIYTGSRDGSGATAKRLAAKFGAPIKTVADAKKRTLIMGTSGKASTSYLIPSFINKTLGTKCRIILGYKNCGTMNLAMQKA